MNDLQLGEAILLALAALMVTAVFVGTIVAAHCARQTLGARS